MLLTGRKADGSHLPACFQLQLTDLLPKQALLNGSAKANQKETKGKGQGKVPNDGEVKGPGGKGRAAGAGKKTPSHEHSKLPRLGIMRTLLNLLFA